MLKPIFQLKENDSLRLRVSLTDKIIKQTKYASECDRIYGEILPGTLFRVVKTNVQEQWVILATPYDPPGYLKLAGGDLAHRFD